MTQATVEARQEMEKLPAATKRGVKRAAKPEPKKSAKKSTPPPSYTQHGGVGDLMIGYNEDHVNLQKTGSFRLYPRQLRVLGDRTMDLTTAMQDGTPISVDLPNGVTVSAKQYNDKGLYVELSKPLRDSEKMWTLSLKLIEFSYLLENIDDLLLKFPSDSAKTAISASDVFDIAVKIYVDLCEEEVKRVKKSKCNGCIVNHPSQDQHDVCMDDDLQDYQLDDAFGSVSYERFQSDLQKKTEDVRMIMTPKLLWSMCKKQPLGSRIKEVILAPYQLKKVIDALDEAYNTEEGTEEAAAM